MSQADARAFDEATMAIRLENLQHLFGDQAHLADARLLSMYRRELSATGAGEFLEVFDRLVAACDCAMLDTAEFQRVRAIQLAELAYRLLPISRWKAADLFRRAIVLYPDIVGLLPWPRIAALLLLGENARRIFLAITGGR
jgi:hypothetical protein